MVNESDSPENDMAKEGVTTFLSPNLSKIN